jgi:DNA adenine methylase
MDPELIPQAPVVPVAPWLGGKRNLANRIIARLQVQPHTTYVEPFVGMGVSSCVGPSGQRPR